MAVTVVTKTTPLGNAPVLPLTANSADLTMTALTNTTDGFEVTFGSGQLFIVVRNANVGAQTVTINSVADVYNRTGNITTYSIGAGEIALFGPFLPNNWRDSNGKVTGTGSVVTDLTFGAFNV